MSVLARHWAVVRESLAAERARARGLVRVDEATFLPAALEIIERPVSPTARATTWLLLVALVITMLWLTFGRIDVVASAPGRLIPAENVKLVQPAEAGVVRAILVREGQRVRAGQPLVELDPTVSTAEAAQAGKALETAQLDVARAQAVLRGLDGHDLAFRAPAGTAPAVAATQAALAHAELDEILAATAGHASDSQAATSARREALGQATKLEETLPLIDQELAANEELFAKGYVSKLHIYEIRRQRLTSLRDRDIALTTADRAGHQMMAARSQANQSRAEARSRILGDLAKAEAEANLRQEELSKASRRSSLQQLLSPVDGTIAQLAIHTVGGVVEPAKPIMIVVPRGGPLVAEVKLLNRDAGFVRVGQAVALKLDAFPFTRYGTLRGKIESVSSDATEDEKLGLVYTARIRLSRPTNAVVRPVSGMAVTADVRTGERSILSYLISPIDEARQEAAHER